MTPGSGVIVDVKAAGVSFPELLQTRGEYQMKPDLPFVPGSRGRRHRPRGPRRGAVKPGDRVAAFCMLGAWAERAVAPDLLHLQDPRRLGLRPGRRARPQLPHRLLRADRCAAGWPRGRRCVVHGAAGGVGTAVAPGGQGHGAPRRSRVVSTDAKEQVARQAGADEVVRSDGPWKDQVKELTDGGADMVLDPVGGDRFTDSLRCLREGGRVVVVGFTGGSIPEVRVNRLLLNNTEVIGAGWGASVLGWPERTERIGRAIEGMIESGQIHPIVGARFPLERAPPTRSSCSTGAARPARSFSTSSRRPTRLWHPRGAMHGLIERYRERLPFDAEDPVVSLGEGSTPLVLAPTLSERVGAEVWCKLEGLNPTGSFKDRGMTCAVSAAVREGAEAIVCASTGNTAASARRLRRPRRSAMRGDRSRRQDRHRQAGPGAHARGPGDRPGRQLRRGAHARAPSSPPRHPIALVNSVNEFRMEGQKTAAYRDRRGSWTQSSTRCASPSATRATSPPTGGASPTPSAGPRMLGFQAAGAAPLVHGAPVEHPETVASRDPHRQPRPLGGRHERHDRVRRRGERGHRRADPVRLPDARLRRGHLLRARLGGQRRRAARPRRRRRAAGGVRAHRPRAQGSADRDGAGRAPSCPAPRSSPRSSAAAPAA